MDSFKQTVLYVSIVILIIALIVIGLSISRSIKMVEWPPVVSKCPDFWKYDDSTEDCVNVKDLGNANDEYCPSYPTNSYNTCEKFNFNDDPKYSSSNEKCEKQKFSNALGLNWDGITNNNNVCEDDN